MRLAFGLMSNDGQPDSGTNDTSLALMLFVMLLGLTAWLCVAALCIGWTTGQRLGIFSAAGGQASRHRGGYERVEKAKDEGGRLLDERAPAESDVPTDTEAS